MTPCDIKEVLLVTKLHFVTHLLLKLHFLLHLHSINRDALSYSHAILIYHYRIRRHLLPDNYNRRLAAHIYQPPPREIVLESLLFCRQQKELRLYAYVLMENHLHLIAEAPDLTGCVQSFKRHTARSLIHWAASTNKDWLLHQFA